MTATLPLAAGAAPAGQWQVVQAPGHWRALDFISDLHLQESETGTFEAWRSYMTGATADAIFILGDLFEVWVGDDAVDAPSDSPGPRFEARCAAVLHATAQQRPVYFMRGNRDFLLGADFLARSGMQDLQDPAVLIFQGQRWLLSHGDALCLDDHGYMQFRAEVRSPAWQASFLARPLAERVAMARQLRAQSEAHKLTQRQTGPSAWVDLDAAASRQWLQAADSATLIHGHTHQPAQHDLGMGLTRIVLSDWDAAAQPPRCQVLRLSETGLQRIELA